MKSKNTLNVIGLLNLSLEALKKQRKLWDADDAYLKPYYKGCLTRTINVIENYTKGKTNFMNEKGRAEIIKIIDDEFIKIYPNVDEATELLKNIWYAEFCLDVVFQNAKDVKTDIIFDYSWQYRKFIRRDIEPLLDEKEYLTKNRCRKCNKVLDIKNKIKPKKTKKDYVAIRCKCGHVNFLREASIV